MAQLGAHVSVANPALHAFRLAHAKEHRFTLTAGLFAALDYQAAKDICRDLAGADLLHLPYPTQWISLCVDDMLVHPGWSAEKKWISPVAGRCYLDAVIEDICVSGGQVQVKVGRFMFGRVDGFHPVIYDMAWNESECYSDAGIQLDAIATPPKVADEIGQFAVSAATCLIASLSARNVQKQTSMNTRIGSSKPSRSQYRGPLDTIYISNTVVSAPDLGGTHASPIPHLRRGHEHTFRKGVGHSETFKKFLPPIYVNRDPGFVPAPKTYVVH